MVEIDLTTRKLRDEKNMMSRKPGERNLLQKPGKKNLLGTPGEKNFSGKPGERNLSGKPGEKNLVESLQRLGLQVQ